MQPKMEDKKSTDGAPAFVVTSTPVEQSGISQTTRSKKKYAIIAVSSIVAVALILTAILVGMYLFTESQKEIIKLTYNRQDGAKEEVTSDSNNNVVQYHVNAPSYELWVVDDFNRDIELFKIVTNSDTNCYLVPLNRTMAVDPSHIATKDNKASNTTDTLYYNTANSPVPDTSFLGKTARDTCKGISTYWLFPGCKTPTGEAARIRRSWCIGIGWDNDKRHVCIGIGGGRSHAAEAEAAESL